MEKVLRLGASVWLPIGVASLLLVGLLVALLTPGQAIAADPGKLFSDLPLQQLGWTIELQDLYKNVAGVSSRYVITNQGHSVATTVHEFYDNGGAWMATESGAIAPGEGVVYDLATISSIPDGYRGYVIISSDQPITGHVVGTYTPPPDSTDALTVYLPLVLRLWPRPPLFVGMTARWDGTGHGRGSEYWEAGSHLTRHLDTMTDADTIRSSNHLWYSPNPFGWPDETWYSYYSISTLEFKASSLPPDPSWKWGKYWILPYGVSLSNGATVLIDGQPFIVSGPYDGYTAFGKPVRYWELVNRDKFLFWDGGDWQQYVHPSDITLRYDAGSTRLLLYSDVLRHYYYCGEPTSDTVQWIEVLTSTNAWPE